VGKLYFVKKHIIALLLSAMLLTVLSPLTFAAIDVDEGLIDLAFKKLDELDDKVKSQAIDLLKDYFKSEGSLEILKQDLPGMLRLFIGEDYEDKLREEGISLSQIKSDIDELKNWSRQDRMALLDAVKNGDKDEVMDLLEKNQNAGSGNGGSPSGGTPSEEEPQPSPPTQEKQINFADIEQHWAKPYILAMAQKGILAGKAQGLFAPEDKVTRAEFATMLVRLLQIQAPAEDTSFSFPDVTEKDWFYEPVKAAYLAGLVKGKPHGFDSNSSITREEMIVLITRAASMKNKSTFVDSAEIEQILSRFKDSTRISDWARAEVAIAVKLGLASGVQVDMFDPKGLATRAQAAVVIYNLSNVLFE